MVNIKNIRRRNYIYDKFQRGFVNICLLTTLVGLSALTYRTYDYIVNVRPLQKTVALKYQEELLKEGSSELLTDAEVS